MAVQTQVLTTSSCSMVQTGNVKLKSQMLAKPPPPGMIATIDFSDYLSGDPKRVRTCLDQLYGACVSQGFFQIINHTVPLEVQDELLRASRAFFAMPEEEKMKLDQSQNNHNRGYQMLGAQKYKPEDTKPDLKEGYYVGPELPWTHPAVVAGKFAHGPNLWPESLGAQFQETCMRYLNYLNPLSEHVLRAVMLALDNDDSFMKEFTTDPICYFKLNHYPKPPSMLDIGQKGHGEHKDFGFITLLLQDENPGLEVWDGPNNSWIKVPPTRGAFVVNMGNLLQRWTNDRYLSNIHRVINHSGTDRHSVAHLYHGNPDFVIKCRDSCKSLRDGQTYPPVRIEDFVRGKYDEVYAMAGVYAAQEQKASINVE